MIPVVDSERPRGAAPGVLLLIFACVAVLAYELGLSEVARERIVDRFALFPDRIVARAQLLLDGRFDAGDLRDLVFPFFSSLFLHGDLAHLVGNMLFLWVFGPAVEARFKTPVFLAMYAGCGLAAGIVHTLVTHGGHVLVTTPFGIPSLMMAGSVPTVGASGAIAGVLGAHFLLFPRARVLTFLPPLFLFAVPSVLFLGLWFVLQFLDARAAGEGGATQIAHWAHVGGFVAGMACAVIAMALRPARFVQPDDELR